MVPFALVDREAAKAMWFALCAGLLTAFIRWCIAGLPERRRPESILIALTALFMIKFYAHELTLGQTNIVLGTLLVGGLLAAQIDQPVLAGILMGAAAFIKPYALLMLPWLAFFIRDGRRVVVTRRAARRPRRAGGGLWVERERRPARGMGPDGDRQHQCQPARR